MQKRGSMSVPRDTLASNPGPHHFDLLDLREEGLGKLPAIFGLLPRFPGTI